MVTEGIDVTKTSTGQYLGRGFYLTDSAGKAMQYCSRHEKKGGGIICIFNAVLGKKIIRSFGLHSYESQAAYNGEGWQKKYDTLIARGGKLFLDNECVVKDGSQLQLVAAVHIEKKPPSRQK